MSDPTIISFYGNGCQSISHGWTSGCTDGYGNTRGFTQEWFFDTSRNAWISSTETQNIFPYGLSGDLVTLNNEGFFHAHEKLNFSENQLSIEGTVSKKIKTHSIDAGSNIIKGISFLDSDIHHVTFSGSGAGVTLNIIDSSPSGYFSEMTLIVENPAAPGIFTISGNNGTSTIKMDEPDVDTLTNKTYMWKIWTINGGSTYYVYRANGYGRYWS